MYYGVERLIILLDLVVERNISWANSQRIYLFCMQLICRFAVSNYISEKMKINE